MKKLALSLLLAVSVISFTAQNNVLSLKDKSGNLWFTVSDKRVYRYDGASFVNFTKANYGSNINVFSCIYEDRSGNIWFNTDRGLCYYDGKNFKVFQLPM